MRILSRKTLREFWTKHSDSKDPLQTWFRETEKSPWKNINDLKLEYPNASMIKDSRIVFNIKGNKYRLIVKINFEYQITWILFLGTHAEYDKVNANKL